MNFKNYLLKIIETENLETKTLNEKVAPNCDSGGGEIPSGPYKGWKVIRTNHLDDIRPPAEKERDAGFNCETFDELIYAFLNKRPLGIKDGSYSLTWKNSKGHQNFVVSVNNAAKTITFVTIIQLNRKGPNDYHAKDSASIFLGNINTPK